MKVLCLLAGLLACALPLMAQTAPPKPVVPPAQRDLLALHVTVARYDSTAYHRCMGMTTLCPDKCGSSGDFASFTVLRYLDYEKLGEYGDPKTDTFTVQVNDNMGNVKVPIDFQAHITALKPGDIVLLAWRHDYVTKDGTSSPERPIILLSSVNKKTADLLLKDATVRPTAPPIEEKPANLQVPAN